MDFHESFASMVKWGTIRCVMALAARQGWKMFHVDVKIAFLNAPLTDEVYMTRPKGYIIPGKEFQVCKLMKELYGLRQVPRTWYGRINNYLQKQVGLKRNEVDQNTYFLEEEGKTLIFVLYVDDLLVIGTHESKIKWLIQQLEHTFEVSDLGKLQLYLNVDFISLRNGIFMCEHTHILEILQEFGLIHCNVAVTILPEGLKMGRNKIPSLLIC